MWSTGESKGRGLQPCSLDIAPLRTHCWLAHDPDLPDCAVGTRFATRQPAVKGTAGRNRMELPLRPGDGRRLRLRCENILRSRRMTTARKQPLCARIQSNHLLPAGPVVADKPRKHNYPCSEVRHEQAGDSVSAGYATRHCDVRFRVRHDCRPGVKTAYVIYRVRVPRRTHHTGVASRSRCRD